jgi:hypothetical protein
VLAAVSPLFFLHTGVFAPISRMRALVKGFGRRMWVIHGYAESESVEKRIYPQFPQAR